MRDAKNAEAYFYRGASRCQLLDFKLAHEDLTQCIAKGGFKPGTEMEAEPYIRRGELRVDPLCMPDSALLDFLAALRLDPDIYLPQGSRVDVQNLVIKGYLG